MTVRRDASKNDLLNKVLSSGLFPEEGVPDKAKEQHIPDKI